MAVSVDELVRELRAFQGRREIVKAIGRGVRKGVPAVRRAIRLRAVETLPRRGGLGAWVAKTRITTSIKLTTRSGSIKLKGGRNSKGGRSDIRAIDRGRLRAPTWGHKSDRLDWHTQSVKPGFFTETAAKATTWHNEVEAEVDRALNQIRRG